MKNLVLIPVTILVAGCLFLTACGNSGTGASMKPSVQNSPDTITQKVIKDSAKMEEKNNGKKEKEENETKEKEEKENEKD